MHLLYLSFHTLQLCECFNVKNITMTLMASKFSFDEFLERVNSLKVPQSDPQY